MRAPLARQGIGPAAAYEHARAQREADRKKLEQITRDIYETPDLTTTLSRLGDEQQLRGIPAIGRGVTGAINGTKPGANIR